MNNGRRRRMRALVHKEFLQIIRDPSSILISVLLPLILLFIYGTGLSLDADHIKIGLVLEDTAPDARSFAESLTNSRFLDVTMARDRREVVDEIEKGHLRGMVVIPSYFSAFREQPDETAPIQVIADGSEPNTAKFVQNYALAAWQLWLTQERITRGLQGLPQVSLQPRFWYNEELESHFFLIPGSLAIIMTLVGTLLTALVISREWERGTMESMLSTPVEISELLMGKLLPYYILAMSTLGMIAFLAQLIYQVPLRGSWFALALVAGVFLIPALALGLLISTVARNQLVSSQIAMVTGFLPAFMLSGFIFEIASMPWPIQIITYILPARYFVSCLQTLFLVGDQWSLLIPNMLPMLAIGVVLQLLTARFTRKRLD